MGPFNTPQRRNGGYSLIELLVVLVIIGVLATAGIYYQMDRNGPAVKGTMVAIAGALTDARSMARGAGQNISLLPSGSGSNIVLTYQNASGLQGQYVQAADAASARFCLVDIDGSANATKAAIDSLKAAIRSTKAGEGTSGGVASGGTTIFTANVWTTNLFDSGSGITFYSNGAVSKEAYVAVIPAVNGSARSDGPVGIILVNASGNLYRYYRSNSASNWVRL